MNTTQFRNDGNEFVSAFISAFSKVVLNAPTLMVFPCPGFILNGNA